MANVVLIVNPFASRVTERGLRDVEAALAPAGSVRTVLTRARGHATELAAAETSADGIVAFGGDGVVNEVLNGLPDRMPFGAVPGGGTSVFARALGLPRDPAEAAARLADAAVARRTRTIGLGRVCGRRFAFALGVGLDAATVRRLEALGRAEDGRRPGDLAFVYELVRVLGARRFRLDPTLEVVGLGRAATVFVANCDPYTYAGSIPVHVAPEARFELGLDLVAPVSVTPLTAGRLIRYGFTGRGQTTANDVVYAHDVDRIEIACDRPLPLQVDGEDLGDVEHVVVEAERDAIDVLV
jgi:diacylglycerol kinase family enzyme